MLGPCIHMAYTSHSADLPEKTDRPTQENVHCPPPTPQKVAAKNFHQIHTEPLGARAPVDAKRQAFRGGSEHIVSMDQGPQGNPAATQWFHLGKRMMIGNGTGRRCGHNVLLNMLVYTRQSD